MIKKTITKKTETIEDQLHAEQRMILTTDQHVAVVKAPGKTMREKTEHQCLKVVVWHEEDQEAWEEAQEVEEISLEDQEVHQCTRKDIGKVGIGMTTMNMNQEADHRITREETALIISKVHHQDTEMITTMTTMKGHTTLAHHANKASVAEEVCQGRI